MIRSSTVARQIDVVRQLKAQAPPGLVLVGSAYSYLQEYLPHVSQHSDPSRVARTWSASGRVWALSYPSNPADALAKGAIESQAHLPDFQRLHHCPPQWARSAGCYPLDRYYSSRPEAEPQARSKKAVGDEQRPGRRIFSLAFSAQAPPNRAPTD